MDITAIAFYACSYDFLALVSIRLNAYNFICGNCFLYKNGKETIDMDYISTQQAAEKWGISNRRVQQLCEQGRIDGAIRFSGFGQFPKMPQAERPTLKAR